MKILILDDDNQVQVIHLPKWTRGKNFYLFAGIELFAYHTIDDDKWMVKTGRCNMCGKCCRDCEHLGQDGPDKKPCSLGLKRPWGCCITPRGEGVYAEQCTEMYE